MVFAQLDCFVAAAPRNDSLTVELPRRFATNDVFGGAPRNILAEGLVTLFTRW